MLLERSTRWPRPQIGEALTPGVRNILDLLDANHALTKVPHLAGWPTRSCWRGATPETVQQGDSALVERGAFDAALLDLARERGVVVHQPAQLTELAGAADAWRVGFSTPGGEQTLKVRFILDAHGRQGSAAQRIACAPRLLAIWAEISALDAPPELTQSTHLEAGEHGWLWGARLPDQRLRVMLSCDPETLRRTMPGRPESWLRDRCRNSRLFAPLAAIAFDGRVQASSATAYFAADAWQDGRLKLGDAAFALDPISSSGVEKAMRFSLHATVVIHTALQGAYDKRAIAREFFEHAEPGVPESVVPGSRLSRSFALPNWLAATPRLSVAGALAPAFL